MILWNFWLCDSMKDSKFVFIWICSVFIFPEEYWWIEYGRSMTNFYFGSFEDVLFWFLQEYSDSNMGRTSVVHKGDFLGLKTSMWQLMFCYVQSGSVCNSLILSGNTIYTGIPIIWLSVFFYVHSASVYVTYVHAYIANDFVEIYVGGGVLTFWTWRVYMSILTL